MLYITDDPGRIDAIAEADAKEPAKQRFYVTYGLGTRLCNTYSIVEAKDYATARKQVVETCGRDWAFMYSDADNFQRTIDHYQLKLVRLQPHSTPKENLTPKCQFFTVGVTKPRDPDYGVIWLYQFAHGADEAVTKSINEAFACNPSAVSKDEFKALVCLLGYRENLLDPDQEGA